ncbi:MAG: hypothetical protein IJZ29_00675 [Clostridia bacterium]|nr:hypothetical protein [Clostridia bacterium]
MFKEEKEFLKEKKAFHKINKEININYNVESDVPLIGTLSGISIFVALLSASEKLNIQVLQYPALISLCIGVGCAYYTNVTTKTTVTAFTMYKTLEHEGVELNKENKEAILILLNLYKYNYEKIIKDLKLNKINKLDVYKRSNALVNEFIPRLQKCQEEALSPELFN